MEPTPTIMDTPEEEGGRRPPQQTTVNLLDLAASALASTVAASRPIREKSSIHSTNNDDNKNARLKLDGTVVTDADGEAQGIIVRALTRMSNQIRIVGEESQQEMERHDMKDETIEILQQNERIMQCAKQEIYSRYHRHHDDDDDDDDDDVSRTQPQLAQTRTPPTTTVQDENDTVEQNKTSSTNPTAQTSSSSSSSPILVDPTRISVYVDPLDGTGCYANHQYESVTILISIILDNIPWFGVICKPFGSQGLPSILDTGCAAIYGGCLLGGVFVAGGSEVKRKKTGAVVSSIFEEEQDDAAVTDDAVADASSGGDDTHEGDEDTVVDGPPKAILPLPAKSVGVVQDFVDDLANRGMLHPQSIHASGAGEKSMRLVLGIQNEGLWFWPKRGTSLWDVAASDALLRAMGGRMTDKEGNDLDYTKERTESENTNGIIACIDIRMHEEVMKLFEEGKWDDKLLV